MTRARTIHGRVALRPLALSVSLALAPFAVHADDYLAGLDAAGRAEFEASNGLATMNAQYAYARGLDGRGVIAGVFDSGVYAQTPELAGRVRGLVNGALAPDGSPCPDSERILGPNGCVRTDGSRPQVNFIDWDSALFQQAYPNADGQWLLDNIAGGRYNVHGTHVAGIVGAARNGTGMHGVAPSVDLVVARLDSDGYRDMRDFLQLPGGLRIAQEVPRASFAQSLAGAAAAGARVLNHSWGFVASAPVDQAEADANFKRFEPVLRTLAEGSLRSGMLQVFAAGNNFGGVASTSADLPHYIPEVEPYWLSVVSASADGTLDEFSSTCGSTRQWCVAAPGGEINSTVIEGQVLAAPTRNAQGEAIGLAVDRQQPLPEFLYARISGTSMAAPGVTGALVLLMQRFPYLDNKQVRDVLLTTATDLGAPGIDDQFGWGMVDLRKAIDGPGMLRVDTTVRMDRPGGGTPAWDGPAWDEWRNAIDGPGRLLKEGPGWLRLAGGNRFGGATVAGGTLEFSGDNALTGEVAVTGGELRVTGRLAGSDIAVRGGRAWIGGEVAQAQVQVLPGGRLHLDTSGRINAGSLHLLGGDADIDGRVTGQVDVGAGGRLGGEGELGPTVLAGTIAPGHSIGTLTINGDYMQQPGGIYEAELGDAGTSDLLQVRGQARLQGGTLRLGAPGASPLLGQRWRVLSATQGIEGSFAALDGYAPATPFLAMAARYPGDTVEVEVTRGQSLASAATTRNARSVATAVDLSPDAHPLVQRLTGLMPAQLAAALAPLDGELHASLRSLLLQDTQRVRDAALARARNGQDTFTAQALQDGGEGVWADVQQRRLRLDGDDNAGAAELSGGTMLTGYDHRFDNGWQLGLFGGAGEATARLDARQDRAEVHATHVGLQAGRAWQALAWRVGAAYSGQDVRTRRNGPSAGMDTAIARYDVDTIQWFTELGYRIEGRIGGVEPFVQYAGLRLRNDAAREQGGIAPLSIQRATQDVGLWSAGLRFGLDLSSRGQAQRWLSLRGGLAYQQASGDLTPAASLQWQDGPMFTTWGAPLARSSTLASLGLAARLTPRSLLELDWRGAFADEARDNGIGARYSIRF